MPTNSTAKAIEIGLSEPTIASPSAAVIARPTKMLISTATMILADRSASHRMPIRKASETMALSSAFSLSVPNSSSWIGDRTGQPHPGAIFGVELEVGDGLADRFGRCCARLERGEVEDRPDLDECGAGRWGRAASAPTSSRQEKLAGRPAIASSMVLANMVSGRVISSSVYMFRWTPAKAQRQRLDQPAPVLVGYQHLDQRPALGRIGT